MKRRLSPQLESLERRDLLSYVYLKTSDSALFFNSASEVNMTGVPPGQAGGAVFGTSGSGQNAVGASYSVNVYQMGHQPITSVNYTFQNSLNGDTTHYGIDSGAASYRQNVTLDAVHYWNTVNEYFDATPGTDVVKADVHFGALPGKSAIPDEVFTFSTQVFAPRATIVPTFPPKTGSGSYGINWTDGNNNAIAPGYSSGEYFGLGAPGPAPFKFEGVYNNETPVTGTFFFTQLATPTNIGSKGYLFNGPLETGWTPWNDNYSNGVGIDEWRGYSNSSYPIATFGYTTTVRGWDAPGTLRTVFDDPGFRNPMSSRMIPYDIAYNGNFTTAICFQAWGNSIPIIISSVDWSIAAHYTDTAARDNATTSNAFGKPSSWVGSSSVNLGVPRNNNPRLIPGYNYNVPDFMAKKPTQYPAQGALPAVVAADVRGSVQVPVRFAGPVDDLSELVRPRSELPWVSAKRKVHDWLKTII